MTVRFFTRLIPFLGLIALCACTSNGPAGLNPFAGKPIFPAKPVSSREQYEQSLHDIRLHQTALGIDWLTAGQCALRDSLKISLPYRESGYFSARQPTAIGYLIDARRGDKLLIHIEVQGKPAAGVFLELFEPHDNQPALVAAAKTDPDQPTNTANLTWNVRRTQPHLLRIQPELLRSGRFTVSITREPVLGFPVKGRDSRQISSFYGVPRDGGTRRHEGIDIFAPKGTPVLASVNGTITQTGVNRLGGNGVWLSNNDLNVRLYYAHLDRWNVRAGQQVTIGDTIGFVGNTGNARTTGPHLHFGMYEMDAGPVNPLTFVLRGLGPAKQLLPPVSQLGDSARISSKQGLLRAAPSGDAPIRQKLVRNTAVVVIGGTAEWLRVALASGQTGYLAAKSIEPSRLPLRRWSLPTAMLLRDAADSLAAVMTTLPVGTAVDVLAASGPYMLVRKPGGPTGWVR